MDSDQDDFMYDEDELSEPEDDQDDFDISCDVEAAGGGVSVKRPLKEEDDFSFVCLTPESIVVTMKKCIDEVNSVFEIPSATARILLTYFKWDKEKLLERYYTSDQETLFKEAHVISPHRQNQSNSRLTKTPSYTRQKSKSECEICMTPVSISMLTGLECGHTFCQFCWNEYLMTKILSENTGQNIFCPATKCDILVDENFVLKVLQDQTIRSRYHKLIADGFVQSNRLMKWCPAPDCSNAIKAQYNDAKPVKCLCGHLFCFSCSQPMHDPVRCFNTWDDRTGMIPYHAYLLGSIGKRCSHKTFNIKVQYLKKWLKKCDDDSETSNWISANTKECPKCQVTIEKNGGCNHMVCRNSSCKADFCWVCLGPWAPHGSSWYNCNRYDEKDAQAARDAQASSRAMLERYLFYCNRYMNHLQSSKFEQKLYDTTKEKMETMQQMNMSWIEVQFLKKAVDVLCQCRITLKYTYVFAFYLKKNNHSIMFESQKSICDVPQEKGTSQDVNVKNQDNQRDLEFATEQLSEYLERDINSDDVQEIKQIVQDKYRYCEQRRHVLLEHVYEGYEKEFWEYQDY